MIVVHIMIFSTHYDFQEVVNGRLLKIIGIPLMTKGKFQFTENIVPNALIQKLEGAWLYCTANKGDNSVELVDRSFSESVCS